MKVETLHINLPFAIEKPKWLEFGFMLKFAMCLLAVSIVFLLGFYVFQIGDLLGKSYTIRNQEISIYAGMTNRSEIGSINSLDELEQKVSMLNFVSAGNIRYIPINKNQLVTNIK